MDESHPTPVDSQSKNHSVADRLEQLAALTARLKIDFEPQEIVNLVRQAMQCICDLYLWSTVDIHWLQIHAHAGDEADKGFPSHLDLLSRILQARQQPVLDEIGERMVYIVSISNGPSILGCLVCWVSEISTIKSEDLQWLQIVANCVSLAAEKHVRSFLPQEKLKKEFLQALVTKAFPCTLELQIANLRGFSPGLPHMVMRIEAHERASGSKISSQELLKVVESVPIVRMCPSRLLIPDVALTCLVSQGILMEHDQRKAFLHDLYLAMQNAFSQAYLWIGISDTTDDYLLSIQEAHMALKIGKKVHQAGGMLFYHERAGYDESEESVVSYEGYLERLERLHHRSDKAFQVFCWYLITKTIAGVVKYSDIKESTVRHHFRTVVSLLPEVEDDTKTVPLIDAVRMFATIHSVYLPTTL